MIRQVAAMPIEHSESDPDVSSVSRPSRSQVIEQFRFTQRIEVISGSPHGFQAVSSQGYASNPRQTLEGRESNSKERDRTSFELLLFRKP